jgi:hypothetical protein
MVQGQCIAEIALLFFAAIPQRRKRQRNVKTTLLNNAWTLDIQGTLTIRRLLEYIQLWDLLSVVQLQPEVEDSHIWKLTATGKYSAKAHFETHEFYRNHIGISQESVQFHRKTQKTGKNPAFQRKPKLGYESLFLGATLFRPYERVWKSRAPPKCQIFLWLVAHKCCWTSNSLARRGLLHLEKCPMWPRGWDHWSFADVVHFCKAILISLTETSWSALPCTWTNELHIWWSVGKGIKKG